MKHFSRTQYIFYFYLIFRVFEQMIIELIKFLQWTYKLKKFLIELKFIRIYSTKFKMIVLKQQKACKTDSYSMKHYKLKLKQTQQILSNFTINVIKHFSRTSHYLIFTVFLADNNWVYQVHTVNRPSLTKAIILCLGLKFKRR